MPNFDTNAESTFSAVVVTLNEEDHIRECLEHLAWCDERILIDMYSQDRTVEQARGFATTTILQDLTPHMEFARNRGIEAATSHWIFIVDADEIVPPQLAARIREQAVAARDAVGIWIPRMNYCFGRPVRHVGGFPDYQLRVFRRGAGFYPDRLHSAPELNGPTIRLPIEEGAWILHLRKNAAISDLVCKWDVYSGKEARGQLAGGGSFGGPLALLWTFLSAFRFRFWTLRGYRDGMPGLILSVLFAFYRFETEAKLWETTGYDPRWDPEVHRLRSASTLLWAFGKEGIQRLRGRKPSAPSDAQPRDGDPAAPGRC